MSNNAEKNTFLEIVQELWINLTINASEEIFWHTRGTIINN